MSSGSDLGPLIDIHIREFPVAVWARAQQHTDELLREFTLLAEQARHDEETVALPVRLVRLVDELSITYGGFSGEQEAQMFGASADGTEWLELRYRVPAQVGAAARHLGDLLNEADEFCLAGKHLLTMATPTELVRFREWFLEEFRRQADGIPPTPWPRYAG